MLELIRVLAIANIDDNLLINNILKNKLEQKITIHFEKNVPEALLSVAEKDVILYVTNRINQNLKLINQILEKMPQLPLVVVGDGQDVNTEELALKSGAQDFILKNDLNASLFQRTLNHACLRFQSIREREKERKILLSKQKQYDEVQAKLNIGVWEMDIVNNRMKWSDEMYRLCGYEPQRIQPTLIDFLNLVHTEDREGIKTVFKLAMQNMQAQPEIDFRLLVGRRAKLVKCYFQLRYDAKHSLLQGIILDMSQLMNDLDFGLEGKSQENKAKIREQINSDLTFQVRTPLSSLVNTAFLLDTQTLLTAEQLGIIRASLNDLNSSVNSLLNASVLFNPNLPLDERVFNLHEQLHYVVALSYFDAQKKNIEISIKSDENIPPQLVGDNTKLYQIVHNLLENAIKYSPADEKIKIWTTLEKREGDKYFVNISLRDYGKGISKLKIESLLKAQKIEDLYDLTNN